jgi:hypothetical protein
MKDNLLLRYNLALKIITDLSFDRCDEFFRVIKEVSLINRLVGGTNVSSSPSPTMGPSGRRLRALGASQRQSVGVNTSSTGAMGTTGKQTFAFLEVTGTCRNCQISNVGSFALFDDVLMPARSLKEGSRQYRGSQMSRNLNKVALDALDVCLCPQGKEPGEEPTPTAQEFAPYFVENLITTQQGDSVNTGTTSSGSTNDPVIQITDLVELPALVRNVSTAEASIDPTTPFPVPAVTSPPATTPGPTLGPTLGSTIQQAQLMAFPMSLTTVSQVSTPSPTQSPTGSPTTEMPTKKPASPYLQSIIAPDMTKNFDHLDELGFTAADESNILRISQIKVYTTLQQEPEIVLSLVVTYVLRDGTTSTKTHGAYTDRWWSALAATINIKSDQYITRIELLTDQYIAHMKICTSNDGCFGPFGRLLDVERNTIFEQSGHVIHSFYGYSGIWLDALGVYYIATKSSAVPTMTLFTTTPGAPTTTASPMAPTMATSTYSQSVIAPPHPQNFDHFVEFGFTTTDESNIHKISQIKVYAINQEPGIVLSLVVTYILRDGTTSKKTHGAYTTQAWSTPAVTIDLNSDQHITQIELLTDQFIAHMKICMSDGECFGPFGRRTSTEPNSIFKEPGHVIHSFYGYSGAWVNALGVYYSDPPPALTAKPTKKPTALPTQKPGTPTRKPTTPMPTTTQPTQMPTEPPCGFGEIGNNICPQAFVCCSPFGWCGTGPAYCTMPTMKPTFKPTTFKPTTSHPTPTPGTPTKAPTPKPTMKPTLQPTQLPTPLPTPLPTHFPTILGCTDSKGWFDSYGDGCSWYQSNNNCEYAYLFVGPDGQTALEACCICGGGGLVPTSMPTTSPPTPTPGTPTKIPTANPTTLKPMPTTRPTRFPTRLPTFFPTNIGCMDTPGWKDSDGDGCTWYQVGDRCAQYGFRYAGLNGQTALEACCICGGGGLQPTPTPGSPTSSPTIRPTMKPNPLPTAFPTILGCTDSPGWVDSYGDVCSWYESDNYCAYAYLYTGPGGKTALEACCICGGGGLAPTAMPTTSPPTPTPGTPTKTPTKAPTNEPTKLHTGFTSTLELRKAILDGNTAGDDCDAEVYLIYGPIDDWDVSRLNNLDGVFSHFIGGYADDGGGGSFDDDSFNDDDGGFIDDGIGPFCTAGGLFDLNNWDVSQVTSMRCKAPAHVTSVCQALVAIVPDIAVSYIQSHLNTPLLVSSQLLMGGALLQLLT